MEVLCTLFHDLDVEPQRLTILPPGDAGYVIVRHLYLDVVCVDVID